VRELRQELSALRRQVQKLARRDSALAAQVDVLRQQVQHLQQELRGDVHSIERLLRGNGQTGLTVRLDRVERSQRWRRQQGWLVWGAIAAALANAVAAWLIH
jgi:hypothetical protein